MAEKKNKLAKPKPGPATQRFLDIAEIREDTVVLKDGTVRAVILVSSINFMLKSAEEQQAVIQAYMQFLNGLEYPIQIVVQSRRMRIDNYLEEIRQQQKAIANELLKAQIQDYLGFVQQLVELGQIMSKRFYLVVPYDPLTDKRRGFFQRIGSVVSPAAVVKLKKKQFDERKKELDQRVGLIQSGLNSMSLSSIRLDTQSLIELYYSVYNPDVAEVQRLADVTKQRVEEVGLSV